MSYHSDFGSTLIEKAVRAMYPHGAWFRLSITEQDHARAAARAMLLAVADDILDKAWETFQDDSPSADRIVDLL